MVLFCRITHDFLNFQRCKDTSFQTTKKISEEAAVCIVIARSGAPKQSRQTATNDESKFPSSGGAGVVEGGKGDVLVIGRRSDEAIHVPAF
jgi:hypothetical protein